MGIDVVIEVGPRFTFASAVDWPGWCRRGRGPDAALAALAAYAPRYRAALGTLARAVPARLAVPAFSVVEELAGDVTTDFGAPGALASLETEAMSVRELRRHESLVRACWTALDASTAKAEGRSLTLGPRGGGRDAPKIRDHCLGALRSYTGGLGARAPALTGKASDISAAREAFVAALHARNGGELPDAGSRGGRRWPARYVIRREAWHALDHAWEIEDRLQ